MYHLVISLFFATASSLARAVTTEEITNTDGSHTVVNRVFDVAFGQNKTTIATALFLLGVGLCVSAVWLVSQGKALSSENRPQLSVSVPQTFSAKAFIGFPSLLLLIGATLAVAGVVLFVTEGVYGALI